MYLTLRYRAREGVTVTGAAIDAATDLRAAGMAWSHRQSRWFLPDSYHRGDALARLDPDNPAVPRLEARLDRARGRAQAWAERAGVPMGATLPA